MSAKMSLHPSNERCSTKGSPSVDFCSEQLCLVSDVHVLVFKIATKAPQKKYRFHSESLHGPRVMSCFTVQKTLPQEMASVFEYSPCT